MRAARSTTLRLFLEHCPHAVALYEQGVNDRGQYATGIAAHDALHAAAEGRDIEQVAMRLISHGREGYDSAEAYPADRVFEGVELARRWLETHTLEAPGDRAYYEIGIGFDEGWNLAPYEDADWINTRPDSVHMLEAWDDDVGIMLEVDVGDYKSSWAAGPEDLDTLQRRIQAVLVMEWLAARGIEPDVLTMSIHALRTGQTHQRSIYPQSEEGKATLARWKRQIEMLVTAYRASDLQPSPGVGCDRCPYAHACEARSALPGAPGALDAAETAAAALAAHTAATGAMTARVRALLNDRRSIETPQGAVGYLDTEQATVSPDAAAAIYIAWTGGSAPDDATLGMLKAAGFPSVGQVRKVAAKLSKLTGEPRSHYLEQWLGTKTVAKWGIRKVKA